MTFDERLDRLTERHEALTQSIELMIHENRERVAQWEAQSAQWELRFGQIATILERLTQIADSHERRLDRLEGSGAGPN